MIVDSSRTAGRGYSVTAAISATGPATVRQKRRVYGRPFPKGVAQSEVYVATRKKMQDEVVADLERNGATVSSADKLLVSKYVQMIRSKSHSQVNTGLKILAALTAKYAGGKQPNMTLFDKYLSQRRAGEPESPA
jgi:hypothetical protein